VRRRLWIIAACAVLAAVAAAAALWPRADARRPDIIVIVVDTLRRDHVGAYGERRATTPAIDALASGNVIFTNAYPNSNWTKPSVASLLTGLYVSQHNVKFVVTGQAGELPVTQRLPEEATTLAEIVKGLGYYTLGVVENVHISAKLGFSQGFDFWDGTPYGATNVTNSFIYNLGQTRAARGGKPLFAYVHYFDPHAPYYRTRYFETEGAIMPGLEEAKSTDYRWTTYTYGVDRGIIGLSAIERQRLEDLYDGEVRNADTGIARIVATLKRERTYDNSWIIVTADHGENFYEGKRLTHPHDCFSNAQMRVPLVMKMPKALGVGERAVTDNVQLVDIAPTVMAYLGAAKLPGMVGTDLLPAVLRGEALGGRDVIAESESGEMIMSSRFKYVSVPTRAGVFKFLFDEAADPLEETNLARAEGDTATRLATAYEGQIEAAKRKETVKPSAAVALSKEEVEAMKALGYLQ
jgi:arylsulfatase A-like enzyme